MEGLALGVAFSPDGQPRHLHAGAGADGWRLATPSTCMSGYSARALALMDGRREFLATSGSEQLILWPFDGKDGPMGRQPKLLAALQARVLVVACDPRQPVAAVGYADGAVVLVRVDDGALIEVKAAGPSPVGALGWDADGESPAFSL